MIYNENWHHFGKQLFFEICLVVVLAILLLILTFYFGCRICLHCCYSWNGRIGWTLHCHLCNLNSWIVVSFHQLNGWLVRMFPTIETITNPGKKPRKESWRIYFVRIYLIHWNECVSIIEFFVWLLQLSMDAFTNNIIFFFLKQKKAFNSFRVSQSCRIYSWRS